LYQVRTLTPSAWYTIVLLALIAGPSQAQQQYGQQNGAHKWTSADYTQNKNIKMARPADPVPTRQLDRMIDLPDIPNYSGKTEFISGDELEGPKGVSYRLKFYAKEDADEVGKWYNDALSMYSWKMVDHSPHTCTARSKSGSQATVTVNPCAHKGMASIVTINLNRPNS